VAYLDRQSFPLGTRGLCREALSANLLSKLLNWVWGYGQQYAVALRQTGTAHMAVQWRMSWPFATSNQGALMVAVPR